MALQVEAIDHFVLHVDELEKTVAWYETVLGMRRHVSPEGRISLHFGANMINVRPTSASKSEWFTAAREQAGSADFCLVTSSRPADTIAYLAQCGVAVEKGPTERKGAQGRMTSVYCRDPEGSLVEIAYYDAV